MFTHNRRIRQQLDTNGNGTIDSAHNIVYDADWKPGLEDIVLIFDESDDLQHRFLHGPDIDQPLADEQPAKLHWLLPGQLGTITDVVEYNPGTDTTANINHLTYTSFGHIASQTNSANEPYYTYTAREWDGDAELYYYRARWYDPATGRFVSEDPIGFAAMDNNLFRYTKNSPVERRDPTGWKPRSCMDICKDVSRMLKKDPLAFIAPVPGGGIFCEGESRCVCTLPLQDPIFGVDYVPGECPALDVLIESHERGHDKETHPCDGRDCITRPKFINPSMGKSSECTLRSRDTQRLALLLNDEKTLGRMTDKCIRQTYAHFNMQRAWVIGQCGFDPLRYPLFP